MEKKNKVIKFLTNIYIKNLLLMATIAFVLVLVVLFALDSYTKHNESVTVPNVKGLQVDEAVGILKSSGLICEVVDSVFQSAGVPGAILDQTPMSDSKVKKGRSIYLVVQAKTKQLVTIPSLKDYSQRQAEAQLNALGFNNIIIQEEISQYKGIVLAIKYKGRDITSDQKIPKGATLTMIVGAGGESVTDSTETATVDKSFFE